MIAQCESCLQSGELTDIQNEHLCDACASVKADMCDVCDNLKLKENMSSGFYGDVCQDCKENGNFDTYKQNQIDMYKSGEI